MGGGWGCGIDMSWHPRVSTRTYEGERGVQVMKWIPNWLKPWWSSPAPGEERGFKFFDRSGFELGADWLPYYDPYGINKRRPEMYEWIDIRREDDSPITTTRPSDLHPMMNVIGLYWRPSIWAESAKQIEAHAIR